MKKITKNFGRTIIEIHKINTLRLKINQFIKIKKNNNKDMLVTEVRRFARHTKNKLNKNLFETNK